MPGAALPEPLMGKISANFCSRRDAVAKMRGSSGVKNPSLLSPQREPSTTAESRWLVL